MPVAVQDERVRAAVQDSVQRINTTLVRPPTLPEPPAANAAVTAEPAVTAVAAAAGKGGSTGPGLSEQGTVMFWSCQQCMDEQGVRQAPAAAVWLAYHQRVAPEHPHQQL